MGAGRRAAFGLEVVGPSERVHCSRLFLVLIWLSGLLFVFVGAGGFSLHSAQVILEGGPIYWWEMCMIQTCFSPEWPKTGVILGNGKLILLI